MTTLEMIEQREKEAQQVKESGVINRIQGNKMTSKCTLNKEIDENLTLVGIENFGNDDEELTHYHREDGFGF